MQSLSMQNLQAVSGGVLVGYVNNSGEIIADAGALAKATNPFFNGCSQTVMVPVGNLKTGLIGEYQGIPIRLVPIDSNVQTTPNFISKDFNFI